MVPSPDMCSRRHAHGQVNVKPRTVSVEAVAFDMHACRGTGTRSSKLRRKNWIVRGTCAFLRSLLKRSSGFGSIFGVQRRKLEKVGTFVLGFSILEYEA